MENAKEETAAGVIQTESPNDERRKSEEARVAELQSQVDELLLQAAKTALEKDDIPMFLRLSSAGLGNAPADGAGGESADGPTRHEWMLDWCRVAITGVLVLALFVILVMVSHPPKGTTSNATPYVSLLSGLTGIALGWMFTSMGPGKNPMKSSRRSSTSKKAGKKV